MQYVARVHALIFQQLGLSLNIVFFIEILGKTLALCLIIKRTVVRKIIKRAFVDAEFSQPDIAEMDDDDSWLR
jgi:hypothetical protein